MATVKEKMTALADEVREISGSEELMGLDDMQQNLDVANENVQTESDLIEQIQVALENKISVDLSDYATIEYVDEAIAAADVGEDIYVQAEEPTNAEDGTVWIDLDENIEVKAPDTTLSIAGEPADAKAVGDALANKQPAGNYALKSDIPTDYLTEVPAEYITETELNAKGYLTSFTETDPTVPAWAKTKNKPVYTASEVGADAVGTANSAVSSHNSATNAHSDIRAKIGDLTALNTTAKDNLVAAINEAAASGGSGGADSNIFIVTVDAATMTASHSASEIGEAKTAGKLIYAMISQSGAILQLYSYSKGSESVPNSTKAFFTTSTSVEADNTAAMLYMMVADDKTVTYEARQLAGVPTGGTAGQVLTKGSDGNPVWSNVAGGGGSGGSTTARHTLFSNSALTSAFAGQTITIENLANYDEFYIECASDSQDMNFGIIRTTSTFEYSDGSTYVIFATFIYNGAAVQISRTLKISGNNIIISDCAMLSGTTVSISNQFMIPVKIVGKKYNIIGTTLPAVEEVTF